MHSEMRSLWGRGAAEKQAEALCVRTNAPFIQPILQEPGWELIFLVLVSTECRVHWLVNEIIHM